MFGSAKLRLLIVVRHSDIAFHTSRKSSCVGLLAFAGVHEICRRARCSKGGQKFFDDLKESCFEVFFQGRIQATL